MIEDGTKSWKEMIGSRKSITKGITDTKALMKYFSVLLSVCLSVFCKILDFQIIVVVVTQKMVCYYRCVDGEKLEAKNFNFFLVSSPSFSPILVRISSEVQQQYWFLTKKRCADIMVMNNFPSSSYLEFESIFQQNVHTFIGTLQNYEVRLFPN